MLHHLSISICSNNRSRKGKDIFFQLLGAVKSYTYSCLKDPHLFFLQEHAYYKCMLFIKLSMILKFTEHFELAVRLLLILIFSYRNSNGSIVTHVYGGVTIQYSYRISFYVIVTPVSQEIRYREHIVTPSMIS